MNFASLAFLTYCFSGRNNFHANVARGAFWIIFTKKNKMILQDNNGFTVNMRSIVAIEEGVGDTTRLYPIGSRKYLQFDLPFPKVEEVFNATHNTDDFGHKRRKSEFKEFPPVEVGESKFVISYRSAEFEDGLSSVIIVDTNFTFGDPFVNELRRMTKGLETETIYGIKKTQDKRYSFSFNVAKLFDVNEVCERLSKNIASIVDPKNPS